MASGKRSKGGGKPRGQTGGRPGAKPRSAARGRTATRPAPRAGAPRGAWVLIGLCALLVVANNAGWLQPGWTERLVVNGRQAWRALPRPVARVETPTPAPAAGLRSPVPAARRPDRSFEPAPRPNPPAVEPVPVPAPPQAAEPAPPRTAEPAKPATPAPPQAVEPAPPAAPTDLLTPDQRRERLRELRLPEGFTAEWRGGPASLSVAANELARAGDRRRVALTIDGCFDDRLVPTMLELLAAQQVKATFFLTGIFARKFPATVKAIAAAGHEVANHSLDHPDLTKLTPEAALAQVTGAERLLLPLAGAAYRPYFRPPFGARDTRLLRNLIQQGFLPVYWTVDTLDWQPTATAESVLAKVTERGLEPGAILLCHAAAKPTLEALPRLIALLRSRELEPCPLSRVMQP